jgi:hypothetical protein
MANGLCLGEGTEKSNHRYPGCCARAESGHAAAAPPSNVMKSRRLMGNLPCRHVDEVETITGSGRCASQQNRAPDSDWVNGTHYRAAALLSALPRLAESIRAAKRFRVVHRCELIISNINRRFDAAVTRRTAGIYRGG